MMRPTVLMVDDHAGFRARARAMLEAQGFDVVADVSDGEAAIDAAARLRPDVALVDIGLPGLDGFAVARHLRSAGTAARVVLISGREPVDFGGRVEASDADAFIAKVDLSGTRLREAIR
jgi:DNA-binding NarL/FixJ family response regulator